MPYATILTTVPHHKKILKAGPAAAWLWLCGLCYCQAGLTDGFIPRPVLSYLGVPSKAAKRLAARLVTAGLWEEAPDGWWVHDYFAHKQNKSASQVASIRQTAIENGKLGGRKPKTKVGSEQETEPGSVIETGSGSHTATPPTKPDADADADADVRGTAAARRSLAHAANLNGNHAVIAKLAFDLRQRGWWEVRHGIDGHVERFPIESEANLVDALKDECARLGIERDTPDVLHAAASAEWFKSHHPSIVGRS